MCREHTSFFARDEIRVPRHVGRGIQQRLGLGCIGSSLGDPRIPGSHVPSGAVLLTVPACRETPAGAWDRRHRGDRRIAPTLPVSASIAAGDWNGPAGIRRDLEAPLNAVARLAIHVRSDIALRAITTVRVDPAASDRDLIAALVRNAQLDGSAVAQ